MALHLFKTADVKLVYSHGRAYICREVSLEAKNDSDAFQTHLLECFLTILVHELCCCTVRVHCTEITKLICFEMQYRTPTSKTESAGLLGKLLLGAKWPNKAECTILPNSLLSLCLHSPRSFSVVFFHQCSSMFLQQSLSGIL